MQHNIPTPCLFKARKGDAEATLRLFDTWTKNMGRYFQLTKPRNQAGAPVDHTETEKMALALLIGGQGLEDLLKYTGKVVVEEKIEAADPAQSTYTAALTATKAALRGQVNEYCQFVSLGNYNIISDEPHDRGDPHPGLDLGQEGGCGGHTQAL